MSGISGSSFNPFDPNPIYAPVLASIDPRSGRHSGGAIEGHLLGAAVAEMGRYYGLPVRPRHWHRPPCTRHLGRP